MAENVTLEKVLLGDTTKEYVDKVNKAIDNVNSNSDAIEDLTEAVANAGKVDNVKVNDISVVGNKVANVKINGSTTVNVETSSTGEITISAPTLAKSLTLSVDPSTYVLTATLEDANGTVLSTPTVDLPLETMVVGASYDESTKEIVLTLQNKETTRFSVADLVSGLVGTDKNFTDGQVLIADGNAKKAKSSGYTIKTSVPANAKFTDTTYDPATPSKQGLMSADDKAKLDGIDSSLVGVTKDEIGKVKDVKVNGTTVLGTDGVANITIDDLKAGYVSVQSSSLVNCVVDGTTYKAIKVADTDTELEVYNSDGNKILTHTVRKDGFLYICVGTNAISCTLRKINGNSVSGGGTVDSEGFRNAKWIEIEDNSDIQHTYINKLPLNGKPSLLLIGVYDTASSSKPIRTLKFFIPSLQNLGKSVGTIYIADDDPSTINNQKIDVFEMSFNDSNTSASLSRTSNFSNSWRIYSIILVRFD